MVAQALTKQFKHCGTSVIMTPLLSLTYDVQIENCKGSETKSTYMSSLHTFVCASGCAAEGCVYN